MRLVDEEAGEIARILSVLPEGHAARVAFERQRTAEQIMYVLIGQPDLLDKVRRVHEKSLRRRIAGDGIFDV